jgi:hypothetical protein
MNPRLWRDSFHVDVFETVGVDEPEVKRDLTYMWRFGPRDCLAVLKKFVTLRASVLSLDEHARTIRLRVLLELSCGGEDNVLLDLSRDSKNIICALHVSSSNSSSGFISLTRMKPIGNLLSFK